MAIPVVTLAGARFSARVSAAIIDRCGLSDWVAASPEKYVEIALQKARDVETLRETRRSLRQRLAASPVLNAALIAREIEAAYRDAWRAWCGTRAC